MNVAFRGNGDEPAGIRTWTFNQYIFHIMDTFHRKTSRSIVPNGQKCKQLQAVPREAKPGFSQ